MLLCSRDSFRVFKDAENALPFELTRKLLHLGNVALPSEIEEWLLFNLQNFSLFLMTAKDSLEECSRSPSKDLQEDLFK